MAAGDLDRKVKDPNTTVGKKKKHVGKIGGPLGNSEKLFFSESSTMLLLHSSLLLTVLPTIVPTFQQDVAVRALRERVG